MTLNVVPLPSREKRRAVEHVLADASEHCMDSVLVLGMSADGTCYMDGNLVSGPEMLWLLEWAKVKLMEHA